MPMNLVTYSLNNPKWINNELKPSQFSGLLVITLPGQLVIDERFCGVTQPVRSALFISLA